MSRLTFVEFSKLSYNERIRRYDELSDHDKFLARTTEFYGGEKQPDEPWDKELTKEEVKALQEFALNNWNNNKEAAK